MKLSAVSACDAVTRWALLVALFLTPIFFLPLTLYPVDLNKQLVFISLVLIAAIAWLITVMRTGAFEYAKSPANIPLAALVVFVIISAFFSGARHVSFMGRNGGEVDTAIAVIGFTLLYFLIAASFRKTEDFKNAYSALMVGAVIAMVAALPATFNALAQFVGYPFTLPDFLDIGVFNTVGTANAFGLYAGLMAVLAFAGGEYFPLKSRLRKGTVALTIVCLCVAFLVGYWVLYVALAAAFFFIALLAARGEVEKEPRGNGIPLAVIVIAISMLVLGSGPVSIPLPRIATPPEVAPSVSASLRIAQRTARESVKNFILGSGPASYEYQYGKYRDAGLNQTPFWGVQFMQGFNAILTHLVSWGIIGTIIFIVFLAAILRMLLRLGKNRRMDRFGRGFAVVSLYSALALILYPQNFTLYFFIFVFAGMVTAAYAAQAEGYTTLSLASSPYGAFAWPLSILLFSIAFVALLYINGRRYVASVQFARGIAMANATKDIEKALPLLMSGVALDSENDAYWQALASAYIARANALVANTTPPNADIQKKVMDTIAAAVASAERGAQANGENAQNWIALGQVYEAAAPFNGQAVSSALAAYEKAALLQPANPMIPAYSGNVHKVVADRMKTGNAAEYAAALASFEKALVLKPDYAPAHFAIIRMFDSEGKANDAIARAERLRMLMPNDAGVLLELGIAHYNASRVDKAQDVLEQAVRLSPDYANALYFLGLTYEKQGDHVRSLAQFEHVLQLNPENKEIKEMVDTVRAGKPLLIAGSSPPLIGEKK